MTSKPSWDDIESVELETKGDDRDSDHAEKRNAGRLTTQDIKEILKEKLDVIHVQVATRDGVLPGKGVLQDVHFNGMGFTMENHGLKIDQIVMVGTLIGKRLFTSQSIVRWQSGEKVGLEFTDASAEDRTFFKDLYAAKLYSSWT